MASTDEKALDLERNAGFTTANETSSVDETKTSNYNTDKSTDESGDAAKGLESTGQDGVATKVAQTGNGDVPPEAQRTDLEMALIMVALCAALFLAALDATIVTTAIPTIVNEFNSPSGYTWVGAAYTLASSATVPSWGKVSDIWGRKPVLLVAVGIFWIGSLIAALSKNIGQLIAARAIQGAGGGGIIVLINIAVSDLVSVRKRGQYYGIFGGIWALASAIGPVLGGVFTAKVRSFLLSCCSSLASTPTPSTILTGS